MDYYPDKQDNFSWFKVVSTHQVGHLEFGSFLFDFTKPSGLFDDRRSPLEDEVNAGQKAAAEEEGVEPSQALTDIGRFLSLFQDRQLECDLFTVLYDCRLDDRNKVEYLVVRSVTSRLEAEVLANRPNIEVMGV